MSRFEARDLGNLIDTSLSGLVKILQGLFRLINRHGLNVAIRMPPNHYTTR